MHYLFLIFVFLFVCIGKTILCSQKGILSLHNFDLKETLSIRAFAAFAIFLCHTSHNFSSQWTSEFGNWGTPSVAVFFFLSGYGLMFSLKHKGESYLNNFLSKRLSKILVPFVVVVFVWQSYQLFEGSFSLGGLFRSPSPFSWFIYALIVWYFAFYVIFRLFKKLLVAIIMVWVFTFVYFYFTVTHDLVYYWISILPMPLAITYVNYEDEVKLYISNHSFQTFFFVLLSFVFTMSYVFYSIHVQSLPGWGPLLYTIIPFWILYLTYLLGGGENIYST